MSRAAIVLLSLLALQARTCGEEKAGHQPAATVQTTAPVSVDLSNPYAVAGKALEAYRARDYATWSALLLEPPESGTAMSAIFKHELVADDAVQGLYFLDDGKTIAAIHRPAEGEVLSMWFRMVRTDDGFRVERLMVTEETPPTDMPVEG